MKLNIAAVSAVAAAIGLKPEIGVESQVFVAPGELIEVGEVDMTGAATSDSKLYSNVDLGAGLDLHAVCVNACSGSDANAITITLAVVLDDDAVDTATATFDIPSWSTYQANKLPIFLGTDFVPDTLANVDKKIKSVTAINSVANGEAGNSFKIYATPPKSAFTSVGCTRGKSGAAKIPATVEVACGYDSSAHTKIGRSESANLTISFAHASSLEALNRFNGHRCLIWMRVIKDNKVHWENYLYSGYLVRATAERGDGNDEVTASSGSPYEKLLMGYAR